MHATLQKFNYPDTVVREYEHWVVLMRPQQCTLGALVLVAKSAATSFATLPEGAYGELARVTKCIETSLSGLFKFEKINYLMLMMVDPQCHFHVLPRYSTEKLFDGVAFTDPGWPGPPELKFGATLTDEVRLTLLRDLKVAFAAC